jgi:hypothetical protein
VVNEKIMPDEERKKIDPRVEHKIISEAWTDILLTLLQKVDEVLMKLIQSPGFRGNRDKLRTILRDIKAAAASLSSNEGPDGNRKN